MASEVVLPRRRLNSHPKTGWMQDAYILHRKNNASVRDDQIILLLFYAIERLPLLPEHQVH